MPSIDLWATLASVAIYAAIFVPLERLAALRGGSLLRPALATDLVFMLASFLLWTPVIVVALGASAYALRAIPLGGLREAFAAQPLWLQLPEAMLLSDIGIYWFHRASHRVPWLWRFHRTHHTAERVDWVAAYREHPVDNLLTRAVENAPLLLLGVPMHVLAGFIVFRGLWALFIHANLAWSAGPLGVVLGSPRLHHWHHEPTVGQTSNFANLNPLMDLLFGTYHDPGRFPERAGIDGEPRRGYIALLLAPLLPTPIPVSDAPGEARSA